MIRGLCFCYRRGCHATPVPYVLIVRCFSIRFYDQLIAKIQIILFSATKLLAFLSNRAIFKFQSGMCSISKAAPSLGSASNWAAHGRISKSEKESRELK